MKYFSTKNNFADFYETHGIFVNVFPVACHLKDKTISLFGQTVRNSLLLFFLFKKRIRPSSRKSILAIKVFSQYFDWLEKIGKYYKSRIDSSRNFGRIFEIPCKIRSVHKALTYSDGSSSYLFQTYSVHFCAIRYLKVPACIDPT